MDDALSAEALKERLPRAFYALFAHHPWPRPIQLAAVVPILEGREALLLSPTASGKTEALLAVPLERLSAERRTADGPRLLYVCPTRALVNDLHRRMERPISVLGLTSDRRTADHRPGERWPDVLFTTPESLDSMLARKPTALSTVRWLILDELHQLAGSARGDQTAALVARLRRVGARAGLTVLAGSATVAQIEAVAARYLERPVLVVGGASPFPDVETHVAPGVEGAARVLCQHALAGGRDRKTLVFTNARLEAESLTQALRGRPPFGASVFVHHGSLDREERLHVEARIRREPGAACIATPTLELGVDIGDVDRVVLRGAPPSVASLVQRVGRGGRRGQGVEVLALVESLSELLHLAFLVDRAKAGDLLTPLSPYHPATVLQQARSLAFQSQRRLITPAALLERLPPWQAKYWTLPRLDALLRRQPHDFVPRGLGFTPTDELHHAFERGRIHTQIDKAPTEVVREAGTGRALGEVRREQVGSQVMVAGRLGVVRSRGDGGLVLQADGGAPIPGLTAVGGATGTGFERSREEAEAYFTFLGLNPLLGANLDGFYALPSGTAEGTLLAKALLGKAGLGASGYGLESVKPLPERLPMDKLRRARDALLTHLGRRTGQGPDFGHLSPEEQARALDEVLPLEDVQDRYEGRRFIAPDEALAARLRVALGRGDERDREETLRWLVSGMVGDRGSA